MGTPPRSGTIPFYRGQPASLKTQTTETAYEEVVELFARGSGPAEILRFRLSPTAQERARYLLEQNQAGTLTEDEAAELEQLGQLEHIVQLVKARIRLQAESGS